MKCPYCNSEMEHGILQAQRYILWTKHQHKFSYHPKGDDILLGEKVIGDVMPEAYICKNCKKILIDYATVSE